jgi:hypothetical protein
MASSNPALAELLELIDDNKQSIPDYTYMKMMECMMKFSNSKQLDEDEVIELRRLRDRNSTITDRLFQQYYDKKRCSVCKRTDHTKEKCRVSETIIIRNCEELGIGYDDAHLYMYAYTHWGCEGLWLQDVLTGVTIGRIYPVEKELTESEMIGFILLPHPTDPTRKLQLWVRTIEMALINDPSTSLGMFD